MATKKEMMIAVKAVQANFCNQKQVQKCLEIQRSLMQDKGQEVSLLTIMKKKGYLTSEQIKAVKASLPKIRTITVEDNPIEGYKLIRKIGQGGMAIVFLASHPKHGEIALKILFPHHNSNLEYANGFMNEAQLVCSMNHPNLVRGLDHGKSNDHYFLAMEYVDGSRSVKDVLDEQGPFEEDTALHIIVQVAKALVYISSCGILHRDIKPDNTLITSNGTVKVCDLGFAKTIEKNAKKSGLTCGTVQYISPEQAKGQGDVDVRSDIYSLGATLYHLVVGKVPFTGADSMEVMAKQVLESLSDIKNRRISHHMHYFIEKMMAKDRDIRYQSPQELIEDIENTIEGKRSLNFDANQIKIDLFKKAPEEETPRKEGSGTRLIKRDSSVILGKKIDTRLVRSERENRSSDREEEKKTTPLDRRTSDIQIKTSKLAALRRKGTQKNETSPKEGGALSRRFGKTTKTNSTLEGLQNLLPSKKDVEEKPEKKDRGISSLRRKRR